MFHWHSAEAARAEPGYARCFWRVLYYRVTIPPRSKVIS